MFIHYLVNLNKEALASEIFQIQRAHNLPGLVEKGKELLQYFCLPNIIDKTCPFTKLQWKQKSKRAVYSKYEENIKIKISGYSKLKDGPMISEKFAEKSYLSEMTMQ